MTYARRPARRAALRSRRSNTLHRNRRRVLLTEQLEGRALLAADWMRSDFWNGTHPADVNADGLVAPLDALLIVNDLNLFGSRDVMGPASSPPADGAEGEPPASSGLSDRFYRDTNNDGKISPIDALIVFNELNAEGEAALMNYQIELYAAGTLNPLPMQGGIPTISKGTDYDLVVSVTDNRPGARGVFAGYLDVLYNPALTRPRVSEIQHIELDNLAPPGTFRLTFNGQSTGDLTFGINPNIVAGNIQTALGNLSTIGSTAGVPNVEVTFDPISASGGQPAVANRWQVRFRGTLLDQNVNPIGIFSGTTNSIPGLPANAAAATPIKQTAQGVVTDPVAFREAFRSRVIPGVNPVVNYVNALNAGNAADRIDDLGAIATGSAPFPGSLFPVELVRARMTASDAGNFVFAPSIAQIVTPAHDSLLYDRDTPLSSMEIMVGTSVQLNITEFINARPDAVAVNEDATTGANPGVTFNPITGVPTATGSDSDTTTPSPGALRLTAINGGGAPGGAITLPSGATVRFAGTAAVNVTGQNQIPANQIRYIPAPNFFGTDTFTYTVSNTVNSDIATVTVTVNGINDAPILTNVVSRTTLEDTPLVLTGATAVTVSDNDAGTANIQLTLTANSGIVTLPTTTGLTITAGSNGSSTVTVQGPQATINTALNGLTFTPAQNSTANTSIVYTVNDLGNSIGPPTAPSPTPLSTTATMAITITPQNDAPINSVPGAQSVDEGGVAVLTFSATNGNRISVTDADSTNLTVQLTVLNGTLAAVPTTGVTITNIANGIQLAGPAGLLGSGPAGTGSTGINAALNGLTFTPNALFSGLTTLTMNSNDAPPAPGASDQDTVQIDVVPTVRPRARPDSAQFNEVNPAPVPGSYEVIVLGNDTPNTGFQVTLEEFTQPAQGTVTRVDNGTPGVLTDDRLEFDPTDDNFFGTVTFTYSIWDTSANPKPPPGNFPATATATVTITILNTNDPPVAVNDNAVTDEDTPINIPVLNNDSDVDNNFGTPQDTLTAVVVASPANGTVAAGPGGTLRYSPASNFNGTDSFTYRVNDGKGGLSNTATVSITVNPINDAPVAVNDTFSGANGPTEDSSTPLVIALPGVLANDTDADNVGVPANTGLTAVIQSLPTHGTLTLNGDGSFSYQPTDLNFAGTDTFTYRAQDSSGLLSNTATVSLVYNALNDAPIAVADNYQVEEDTTLTVPSGAILGILANDTDVETPNGDLRVFATFNLPQGLVMNANNLGGFTYTPPLNFTGPVSFQYQVTDNGIPPLVSNMATVTITVTEFNDAPTADNDSATTNEDTSVDIDALVGDIDPEGFPLTLIQPGTAGTGTVGPLHGSVTIVGNQFRYTPASNYFGPDSFTYRAQDSGFNPTKQSNIATVSISVTEVNDLPVAVNDGVPNPILIVKDFGPQEVEGLTDNDTDPDNDDGLPGNDQVLRVASVSGATNGTVTVDANGVVRFTPSAGYEGPAQFSYRVSDGEGTSENEATVFLTVVAFVPKDVGGIVYVDSGMSIGGNVVGANNGVFDFIDSNGNSEFDAGEASERTIRGVVMELTGTDFQGDAISEFVSTDIDGRYSFDQLTPPLEGTDYIVTQHQPDYLLDGAESPLDAQDSAANPLSSLIADNGNDSFRLRWEITDQLGDITLRFAERGISAALVNAGGGDSRGLVTDILASSSNKGFVLTTDLSGEFLWSWNLPGWENAAEISLQLDANLASATLTVLDRAGTTFVKRIHQDPRLNTVAEGYPAGANNPYGPRFRVLGRSGVNDYLIRIDGGASDFGLNLQNLVANSSGGEGEGEGNVDPNFARAADEVFSGEAWA